MHLLPILILVLVSMVIVFTLKKISDLKTENRSQALSLEDKTSLIKEYESDIRVLRSSLVECKDREESLKVQLKAKEDLIATLKQEPVKESLPHPVAPPDLTEKKSVKVYTRGQGGRFTNKP